MHDACAHAPWDCSKPHLTPCYGTDFFIGASQVSEKSGYDVTRFFFLLTFAAATPAIISDDSVVYGTFKALVSIRLDQEKEYNGADLPIHRITAKPDTRDL